MRVNASTLSQGGGLMFARLCFFNSSASHSGSVAGNGGLSSCVDPWL